MSEIIGKIKYGIHESQSLDLVLPEKNKCVGGLILFIHGGGWVEGDKNNNFISPLITKYQSEGFASASINYRLAGESSGLPEMLEDITLALDFIYEKCKSEGYELHSAMLVGWSAGAHLALLYGYTRSRKSKLEVKCVFSYSGIAVLECEGLLLDNPLGELL